MTDSPLFQKKQYEFTAYIRDPENRKTPKGVENRRMNIYRDLFFNNVEGFISNGFPVLKSFYKEAQWQKLIRQFLKDYQCQSPYFKDIPKQFTDFLEDNYQLTENDPPFMVELAEYELIELILDVSDEQNDFKIVDSNGDLLAERPVVSSLVWLLAYQWPVHRLDADNYYPKEKPEQETYLIVFRDRNDKVVFIETNLATARLLDILQNNDGLTGQRALQKIAEEMQHPQPQVVIDKGLENLKEFQKNGVILGTKII